MAKHFSILVSTLIFALTLSTNAAASGLTFGAKTGPMQIDGLDDDPTNAGVAVGYEIGVVLGDIGFEGE